MNTLYVTKRLQIKEVAYPHYELHVTWLNNPQVVRYSEQRHLTHTKATQIDYIQDLPRTSTFLEISDGLTVIGTMTIHREEMNKVANIGIMIGDTSRWGKGLGFEAWECVCDDLLENEVRKIEAGCMMVNKPMLGIFQKYEMFCDGFLTNHFIFEGGVTDLVMYGKFKK